jgi:hypothetical protein
MELTVACSGAASDRAALQIGRSFHHSENHVTPPPPLFSSSGGQDGGQGRYLAFVLCGQVTGGGEGTALED